MTLAPIRTAVALLMGSDRRTRLARRRESSFVVPPAGNIDGENTPGKALLREKRGPGETP